MSSPEGAPAGSAGAAATTASSARHARRTPTDLTLTFVDEPNVRALSEVAGEPGWLLADRLAGLAAFESLPIETNQLYTTYIDLRNAHLADVRPIPAAGRPARDCDELPEGAAALGQIDEDGVCTIAISDEARAAGLVLEPLSRTRDRDPELFRSLVEGGSALPPGDNLVHHLLPDRRPVRDAQLQEEHWVGWARHFLEDSDRPGHPLPALLHSREVVHAR